VQPTTHLIVSGALAGAPHELAALGFSQRSSTKIHRTVRYATRLSGETTEQWSTSPNGRLADCDTVCSTEVRSQSTISGYTGLSGVPPDYLVQQKDRRLQRSTALNPNGRLTWHSTDNEQCSVRCTTGLSGVPIDSNNRNSGWGYKYPTTTTIQVIQAFQPPHSILEQKNTIQRHNQSIKSSPSSKIKSSDQKCLVT
jgi:hypothetical protein